VARQCSVREGADPGADVGVVPIRVGLALEGEVGVEGREAGSGLMDGMLVGFGLAVEQVRVEGGV
jgi:hypothetical protein